MAEERTVHRATGGLLEMGGRPIRGNEWLSSSGHSACTARRVEIRVSFEWRKLSKEFNGDAFDFS